MTTTSALTTVGEAAAVLARVHSRSSGSSPWGVWVAVVIVVLLAVAFLLTKYWKR